MVKEIKRSTFSAAHHQQEPGRDAGLLALVRKEQIQTALFNSILQASNYFQLKKKGSGAGCSFSTGIHSK